MTTRTLALTLCFVAPLALGASRAVAGELTAFVVDGTLQVKSAGAAVDFGLSQIELPADVIRVTPNGGTTLNGGPDPITFSGITVDVVIGLKGGSDRVVLANVRPARDLKVRLGNGDNLLVLHEIAPGRDLRVLDGDGAATLDFDVTNVVHRNADVRLGDGPNLFSVDRGLDVGGDLVIHGGLDDDTVEVDEFEEGEITVGGNFRILTGEGENHVNLENTDVTGIFRIVGGADRNFVQLRTTVCAALHVTDLIGAFTVFNAEAGCVVDGNLKLDFSRGTDRATLENIDVGGSIRIAAPGELQLTLAQSLVHGNLGVTTGSGSEIVGIDACRIRRGADLDLGGGHNRVYVAGSLLGESGGDVIVRTANKADEVIFDHANIVNDLSVLLEGGDNHVELLGSDVLHDLLVKTGDGDDLIVLDATTVTGQTTIDHGAGNDVVP